MEEPQSKPTEVLNALEIITDPEFVVAVEEAERQMFDYRFDDIALEDLIEEYEDYLGEMLGEDCYDREASISGVVYLADDDEVNTGVMRYVDSSDLTFVKVTVEYVSEEPRVVLMFEKTQFKDNTEDLTSREVYFAIPISLSKFELRKDVQPDIISVLKDQSESSKKVTLHPDFLQLSLEKQRDFLKALQEVTESTLSVNRGDEVQIRAPRFVVVYDEMPLRLDDCVTEQGNLEYQDWYHPMATYRGVEFVELSKGRLEPFRSVKDFHITGGVPCIRLRNDNNEVTFYVPIDQVEVFGMPGRTL